jgi:hypothetical protein
MSALSSLSRRGLLRFFAALPAVLAPAQTQHHTISIFVPSNSGPVTFGGTGDDFKDFAMSIGGYLPGQFVIPQNPTLQSAHAVNPQPETTSEESAKP